MSFYLKTSVCISLLLCSLYADAQYFSNRYTLNRPNGFLSSLQIVNDTVYAMFQSADTTGNKPIPAFAVFDKKGTLLSTQYFDISARTEIGTNVNTLIRTNNGGFAYGGWTWGTTTTQNSLLLLKYDKNGAFQWYKEITDTNYLYFYTNVFTQDSLSNYYFSGFLTHQISNDNDMYIAKTDSLGNLIYMKVFNDPTLDDNASGLCINRKGHVIVSGGGNTPDYSNFTRSNEYMKVYELDTGGNILNYVISPDSNGPYAANILPLIDGGYMIAGGYICERGHQYISNIGAIARLDSAFNIIWRTDVASCSIYNSFSGLKETPDGSFITIGTSYTTDTVLGVHPQNGIIIKISATGQVIWSKEYSGLNTYTNSDLNDLTSVGFLSDSSIITGGEALDYADVNHPQQGWLLHLDTAGCLPDSNSCGIVSGIENISATTATVKVYPNPANEQITFEVFLDQSADYTVSVSDLLGQILFKSTISADIKTSNIDVRQWPQGLYVYKLNAESLEYSGKFIIVH